MSAAPPPLLRVENLAKHYRLPPARLFGPPRWLRALEDVSFDLAEGETLGLVGESGSGKSTTGRAILRLIEPSAGRVLYRGEAISALPPARFRPYRRKLQMIFQDPAGSLNPAYSVAELIEEPMIVHGEPAGRAERRARVAALLEQVGLDPRHAARYPHEFSGGQRQRIGIARALAVRARLIVADEPVSALDVSVQAQVLNLMQALKEQHGLSYLFIAHDLAVVKHMSQRVAVMYLGRIVEMAPAAALHRRAAHPYTRALLTAVPRRGGAGTPPLQGEIPSPVAPPPGCAFQTRCPARQALCTREAPALREIAAGHSVACHFSG
ncbi:ABC transporter ATP-binding protein [Roseomonas sp. GC11]|uniref:ABC transporter ATP-binding protein n=1 Tax=Roseomonas sp. GC11 TaxID=2950546 RepID=UPI00210B0615|nr:ABC transporter ATP-binding protein [Roseomonas sp. GC11]MCQ4160112.1 ABC transporter ATP-binding protein [Roseomonas sp. GC11]